MALGLPALRVLVEGHARIDAAEEVARLAGIRAAVWAEGEDLARMIGSLDPDRRAGERTARDRTIERIEAGARIEEGDRR
jgi:hypothetical protein